MKVTGERVFRDLGIKPCPFCGRKMVLKESTFVHEDGKKQVMMFIQHEDYPIAEERCLLDEIDMPFGIPAGDARPDEGYLGELGLAWNRRMEESTEK